MPTGFVPDEDQGYVMVLIQAPPGASLDYTMNIVQQVEQRSLKHAGGPERCSPPAASASPARRRTRASSSCSLKDFEERRGEEHSAQAIVGQLFGAFSQITGAMVIPFLPPAINGLGQFGGFTYELLDQSGGPIENLEAAAQQLIAQGNQTPGLTGAVHAVHRQRSAAGR